MQPRVEGGLEKLEFEAEWEGEGGVAVVTLPSVETAMVMRLLKEAAEVREVEVAIAMTQNSVPESLHGPRGFYFVKKCPYEVDQESQSVKNSQRDATVVLHPPGWGCDYQNHVGRELW
mmetsp:Transcript_39061/g.90938  ORF Transcript_39061/g.90938 Transcript_39061/m.90938 type:complete len:118 (+) Transcript_39061:2065-2418(+)